MRPAVFVCESEIGLLEKWQEFGSSGTSLDDARFYCPFHCFNGAVVGTFKSRLTCLHLSPGANVSLHLHISVFIWKAYVLL